MADCKNKIRKIGCFAFFGGHPGFWGVSPRTAQAAMRHSKLELTVNTYTDPRLLDVAGALDVLPALPLDESSEGEREKATGTDPRTLVPLLVPTAGNQRTEGATADKTAGNHDCRDTVGSVAGVKSCDIKSRDGKKRVMGFEPTTFTLAT